MQWSVADRFNRVVGCTSVAAHLLLPSPRWGEGLGVRGTAFSPHPSGERGERRVGRPHAATGMHPGIAERFPILVLTGIMGRDSWKGGRMNTLAMIRQSGEEPVVIEYLKTPPSRERLLELLRKTEMTPRALLREKGTPYADLKLGDPKWTDDQLIDFMLAHPILINRPIVETPKGARLCRPSEKVLEILPNPEIGRFVKEDGEVVSS